MQHAMALDGAINHDSKNCDGISIERDRSEGKHRQGTLQAHPCVEVESERAIKFLSAIFHNSHSHN